MKKLVKVILGFMKKAVKAYVNAINKNAILSWYCGMPASFYDRFYVEQDKPANKEEKK